MGRAWAAAADWLFPPRCAGCGRLGETWCAQCRATVQVLHDPCCLRCGYPLAEPQAACPACEQRVFAFSVARSWGSYTGRLRMAILKLKHKRSMSLGLALSQPLVALCTALGWRSELLVPVPLHPARRAQRGHNPVELLAAPLATSLSLPFVPNALARIRETQPQMDLDIARRWTNVHAAFAADAQVGGRRILLLDDIMTTGATLDAAARALRSAGAQDVYALTLARTL